MLSHLLDLVLRPVAGVDFGVNNMARAQTRSSKVMDVSWKPLEACDITHEAMNVNQEYGSLP